MISYKYSIIVFIVGLGVAGNLVIYGYEDDKWMHQYRAFPKISKRSIDQSKNRENLIDHWQNVGRLSLQERLTRRSNENVAKNVIFFLGDGMSVSTISAARVYLGGEEASLSFDKFPYTALSKTYCIDKQVADSACSATAYLGGVKANLGTIGVTGAVEREDCDAMSNSSNFVYSIAHLAQNAGKTTGLVTTSRVTHASPAGMYAHTAERDWESDHDVVDADRNPKKCTDIASQLVFGSTGQRLNVILGGGSSNFLPESQPNAYQIQGRRLDGINLIDEWLYSKKKNNQRAQFVTDKSSLQHLNESDYLLGLFCSDHCPYNLERDPLLIPSLEEMTEAAIKVLSRNENGFLLFVEGAKIDMGHHMSQAHKALDETLEFSKAVQKAVDMTKEEDTMVVVTADHSHTMSYSGYAHRGQDILGIGGEGSDKLPYTILNYANGPGYTGVDASGKRHNVGEDDTDSMDYRYPSAAPMESETHGGDDVAIFARGPWAHLFTGVMEQNVIPYLISFASCLGDDVHTCNSVKESSG